MTEDPEVRVSAHGYDEMAADGLLVREIVTGIDGAYKLDDVRSALRRSGIKAAAKLSQVYSLTPVSG